MSDFSDSTLAFLRCLTGSNFLTPFNFSRPPMCRFCRVCTSSLSHVLFHCKCTVNEVTQLRTRLDGSLTSLCRNFHGASGDKLRVICGNRDRFIKSLNLLDSSSTFVFTDGSSLGNPGPCGAGAVLQEIRGGVLFNSYRHLGHGTNNIGELYAFHLAFNLISKCTNILPGGKIYIFTDSEYCIGILTKGHSPSSNKELINWIRVEFEEYNSLYDIEIRKVPAHSFVSGNELADKLAVRGARCKNVSPPNLSIKPVGNEVIFESLGNLCCVDQGLFSQYQSKHDRLIKKTDRSFKNIVKIYTDIFRVWSPDETTIDSLFGFPTPNGKFSIHVSKIIVELFGEFLFCLESKFKCLSKDSTSDQNKSTSCIDFLKGRYALVWFPSKDPERGT